MGGGVSALLFGFLVVGANWLAWLGMRKTAEAMAAAVAIVAKDPDAKLPDGLALTATFGIILGLIALLLAGWAGFILGRL
jgi:hypothetical protein